MLVGNDSLLEQLGRSLIANEQPSQEARLRGGSFIESCEGEKFSNSCSSGVTFMSVTIRLQ